MLHSIKRVPNVSSKTCVSNRLEILKKRNRDG
jgi:hypothetical protein